MPTALIAIVTAIVLTQVAIFSTTIYLHRSLTHRAVTFHPIVAAAFKFVTWLTTGIRTRQWVAVHRKHHAHTDAPEDPHSPAQLGWLRVQLTNIALYRRSAKDISVVGKYAKDLPRTRADRLLFDHALLGLGLLVALLVVALGPVAGAAAALVHFVSYVMLSGSVNGPGHHFGERIFDNSATNLKWLAFLTAGEGLHNNHHAAPTSARFGRRWYDLDFGWWVIRATEVLKLADVRHDDVDALALRR